ncbi:MAG: deoxyribose-phosphate aldolase [Bacteroidales bacterium]|nr:deoxyribose-phosphate aldolase [Bacteroidales bacterium]
MKLLAQYNRTFSEAEITQAIDDAKNTANEMASVENYKLAFSCIDLTSLNSSDTVTKIENMTKKVNSFQFDFPEMPNVGAICIYPNFVKTVKDTLTAEGVNIASVTGGFPSSQTFLEIKTQETRLCVQRGADEVDMVISIGEFLRGDYPLISHEVKKIRKAAGDAHLKVILESGSLQNPDEIYKASVISMNAGADFVKTSTGKEKIGATFEAAYVMCSAIKDYYEDTNEKIGFKPAGGISTPEDALIYLAIVKNVLGDEWLNNKLFRFGASRLANKLLSEVYKKEIKYF